MQSRKDRGGDAERKRDIAARREPFLVLAPMTSKEAAHNLQYPVWTQPTTKSLLTASRGQRRGPKEREDAYDGIGHQGSVLSKWRSDLRSMVRAKPVDPRSELLVRKHERHIEGRRLAI